MKRFLILFLVFLFIGIVSAAPLIEFENNNFNVGETIIGKIYTSGEFLEQISQVDFKFYEGRKEVDFEKKIISYEGVYYFYFVINREGNFTLSIEDIVYREAGQVGSFDIEEDIFVSRNLVFNQEENKTYEKVLFINPGIVFTNKEAVVNLVNKGDVDLSVSYLGEENLIKAKSSKQVIFTPEVAFSFLNISTYQDFSIPIIYFGELDNSTRDNETIEPIKLDLKVSREEFSIELVKDRLKIENITLFNFGPGEISNIKISSELDLVKEAEFSNIGPGGSKNISINFSSKDLGNFEGIINISYTQYGQEGVIPIKLRAFVFSNESNIKDTSFSSKTCSELRGTVCEVNEICSIEARYTAGKEYCCIQGSCTPKEIGGKKDSEGGSGWLIGLVILIVVGVIGYLIYLKYKGTNNKSSGEKLLEKDVNYMKRIRGGLSRS